jgi:hypothetical protein
MFEFHGWVSINIDDQDDADLDVLDKRMEAALDLLRPQLAAADDEFCVFELRHTCNDLHYLSVHGLRNHRYEPVIALFQWIADTLPECYGLLYVRDDEDTSRTQADFSNCFRVWRLAQGQLREEADPFLSPCIPVVEKPWPPVHLSPEERRSLLDAHAPAAQRGQGSDSGKRQ